MQFYLDGFHPGDPQLTPSTRPQAPPLHQVGQVDVLIVGTGPAGLLLAAQLAQFEDITTRIVEQRQAALEFGQADGVACRSVEMLEAFGLSQSLMAEAYWVNEVSFWQPDPTDADRIIRTGRTWDTDDELSEFPHLILNQARLLEHLLGFMRRSAHRLVPDYGVRCTGLQVEPYGSHPVRVMLAEGEEEFTVNARFVVGCDGARSTVRKAIGLQLHGDVANHAWGVLDVLAVTDFPDIRLKAAIQSSKGSILLIPREGGYLTRLYVDLGVIDDAHRVRVRAMTSEDVIEVAAGVLQPYTIDVKSVAWFSIYEVAQRLTDTFDDAGSGGRLPRVFIAGDACHTHSAKAGQGMNVSMQDAFNLGWKLAAVLRSRGTPDLLATYSQERRPIAAELIEFDQRWSTMLAAAPTTSMDRPDATVGSGELQEYFVRQGRYTAGVATRYPASMLVGEPTFQGLASGFGIGTRFHSAPVIRVADARSMQLGHAARADGRWRLYAFADRSGRQLLDLCWWLSTGSNSPVVRYTAPGEDIDAVIDTLAIVAGSHRDISLGDLPPVLAPRKGHLGLVDYEKVYCTDHRSGRDIFAMRGIDRQAGCVVVVRPDQFVAHVLRLNDYRALSSFFAPILLEPVGVD